MSKSRRLRPEDFEDEQQFQRAQQTRKNEKQRRKDRHKREVDVRDPDEYPTD